MVEKFKEVDAYGNVYKGDVLNGRRHGQGILLYAQTGDVYQGDFENGLPHGSGKYIRGGKVEGNKDGIFEGLWENGQLTAVKKGKAKIVMENGDVYDGGFNHWKRHGQGKLVEYNGAIYKGQWKEGMRHGFGKQFYPDGYMFEGQFKDDHPVKDGTHKEEFSVIMQSDSIELNPLDTKNVGAGISHEKYKKGIQKPRHRSRSRSDRMTPIYPGQEQRDDSHQMRQNGAQHTHNANFPPRSPSRMSSHRQEKQQNKMIDGIPMTISFPSFSDHQDGEYGDPLKFDDDTGFEGVENQVPSHTSAKKDNTLNAFPRNRSSFSRNNHKNATHGGNTSSESRKQVSHQQLQHGIIVDNASSNRRKGFGFLRPFSRKRSKAKEKPTGTNNSTDVFVNEYHGHQTHSVPFVEMHDNGGEETSGLILPGFHHTRSGMHSRGQSMSQNSKVRSASPMPRSSSKFSDPYQTAASSNAYHPRRQDASGLTPRGFQHTMSDVRARDQSMSSNMKVRSVQAIPRSSSKFIDQYKVAALSNGYNHVPKESSSLTQPLHHTMNDVHSRGRSMSSNIKVRSPSPMPRFSSKNSDHYQTAPSSNGYPSEPLISITGSGSVHRTNQILPQSQIRSMYPPPPLTSHSISSNGHGSRSLPRPRSRSSVPPLSVNRGASADLQWAKETTSHGLSLERKSSSPMPRVHRVQGIQKQKTNQVDYQQYRVIGDGNLNVGQVESRGRSQSRSRTSGSGRVNEGDMAGYNLNHTQVFNLENRKTGMPVW